MNLSCKHLSIRARDLAATKEFYVDTLGLEVITDNPNLLALRAGEVRFSFFGGCDAPDIDLGEIVGVSPILSTDDIDATVAALEARGVTFEHEIIEAPGFMRFTALKDPNGIVLFIAQYIAEVLTAP